MADFSKEFLIRVRADIDKAVQDMNRLTGEMKRQGKAVKNEQTQTSGLSRTFTRLAAAAGAYVTIQAAFKALRIADEYKQIQTQIRLATKETGDYSQVSREIFNIAQRNGVALQGTIRLFRGVARSAKELGASNTDVLKVTEAIQQLALMSGAGPVALGNAMLQFSQAMAAGVVRAEEFNSLVENTPAVVERIALGMGLTVGELRQAVLEGKLLSRDAFGSLLKQAPQIAEEMAAVPDSLARSTERLSNSFAQFLGQLDQATGTTATLASIMNGISSSLDEFVDTRGLDGLARRLEDLQSSGLRGRNRPGSGSAIARIKQDIDEALAALEGPQGLRHKLQQVEDEYNRTLARTQKLTKEIESVPEDQRIEQLGQGRNRRLTQFGQLNRDLTQSNKALEALGTEREGLFNKLAASELTFTGGEGGATPIKLTAEQQANLAGALKDVNQSLAEQTTLFEAQAAAAQQAQARTGELAASFRQAAAVVTSAPERESETRGIDIQQQIGRARQDLAGGDLEGAITGAERARDLIVEVSRAGTESQFVLKFLLGQAKNIGVQAAQALADQQTGALQQVQNTLLDLQAKAKELQSIQVGFDQEAATLAAAGLRANLQAQFNENPLVIPVVVGGAEQFSDAEKANAIQLKPIQQFAGGGGVRGPGTGTSDSILAWLSNGEYVMRRPAVAHYGKRALDQINAMSLPRFAQGGVAELSRQIMSGSGPGQSGGRPIYLTFGGEKIEVSATDDMANRLVRVMSKQALKRGGRA